MFGSLALRKPVIGFVTNVFVTDTTVRSAPRVVRAGYITTALWGCFFATRLLIQVPLWAAGATTALAATKLLMGLPMYAALLWVSWLIVRSALDYAESAPTPRG